jgi:hypothetical protein
MSKYTLKSPNQPPTELGFVYKQYESGMQFSSVSHTECAGYVLQHRLANGYPRATLAECIDDVIDQVCIVMGPDYCVNNTFEAFGFSNNWDRIKAGTKTLATWAFTALAKGKDPYVSQELAEQRADACRNCFARTVTSGCLSCGWMDLVRKLIGETIKKAVKLEESSSCRVCGCLLAAKCHLKPEILVAGTTAEQKSAYKEVGNHCWMSKL